MDGHKKNPVFTLCGILMLLPCILFCSCDSDENLAETHGRGEIICFNIASGKKARSADVDCDSGFVSDTLVLRSDDSSDTLCVQTIVTDGIYLPDSGKKSSISRGTPIEKDNFYEKFHVLAYWKQDGTLIDQFFYMDEDVTDQGGNEWSSTKEYYWPRDGNTLKFYAWAPTVKDDGTNSSIFTSLPSSPIDTKVSYEVPDNVAEQQDILVAMTGDMESCDKVPLTFQHICTAVRFEVGSEMQPGTITKVAFKGVHYSGSYDMETSTWELDVVKKDFSLGMNAVVTGAEPEGAEIIPSSYTFMMLPQTLPAGATLEVVFHDDVMNRDYTLTAHIAGQVWKIGTTMTYKVKINKNYDIKINVSENDKVQDAHYVSFPITVTVNDYVGKWELTSNFTDDVFFTATKTNLQERGYWIDDDKGVNKITGTGMGTFTYYVYVTENVGTEIRSIEFQVTPAGYPAVKPAIANVQQLCPSWDNGASVGYERIEENNGGNYPFGFLWDRKVVFTAQPEWSGSGFNEILRNLLGAYVFRDIAQAAKDKYQADYITIEETKRTILLWEFTVKTTVTIDYSQLNELGDLTNDADGLSNTRNLYFHKGIGEIADIENQLRANAVGNFTESVNGSEQKTVENFAARMAVLKNKFTRKQVSVGEGNQTEIIWVPDIVEENIVWYLPACNEQKSIADETYPLSGTYWSSTAVSDNINAYTYSNGGGEITSNRMDIGKIRAARRKP